MKFAVIGHPIDHSLSPHMHHANFKSLNLDYGYEALNIPPAHFEHIRDIISDKALDGFNVTIPHKERIIEYLDEMSDEARAIGAVNTVKIENGKWIGYNTDGTGFVKGLQAKYGDLTDAHILILGAGGASKGIAYALSQVTDKPISVANRSMSRFKDWQLDIQSYSLQDVASIAHQFDIIINTTPVGMHQSQESVMSFEQLKPDVLVCDIIYIPFQTAFLKEAAEKECATYNGLDMFIYQGAESFKIWTGLDSDIMTMRNAVIKKLNPTTT
ncbi:shikimate dehydrogenase [Staphylococcus intermedius]|uniref:Shikimate dehydrogenase (NADP(+)) n=1 Tax=Staphylococcus intermedius NCTC 11048 TaxID=1141106 RepID=A0A380G774_STAIN|nr:shikimate dehydrogenase [Staphylococcus intermedius]PCF64767.1 shikimate dehydrogenase [Staphylococcus intermedius]PCF80377.1 shikimate dehydrogenase [Staphylococcus intermedius]PCF81727.1 shikimate dehydrogenase [Staphylococcus intermedius]PCF88065.1 shikimate dehydrogenase [Staphylococcus intermedius]PCF88778.1 shikimate dehydrogenase [Staphylococcus intermedius]